MKHTNVLHPAPGRTGDQEVSFIYWSALTQYDVLLYSILIHFLTPTKLNIGNICLLACTFLFENALFRIYGCIYYLYIWTIKKLFLSKQPHTFQAEGLDTASGCLAYPRWMSIQIDTDFIFHFQTFFCHTKRLNFICRTSSTKVYCMHV